MTADAAMQQCTSEVLLFIGQQHSRQLTIEFVGVFWLVAEIILLAAVDTARRHLNKSPLTPHLVFDKHVSEKILATLTITVFLYAYMYVHGKNWSVIREGIAANLTPDVIAQMYHRAILSHLTIWAVFVTGWVLLEVLIVIEGILVFRRLKQILPKLPFEFQPSSSKKPHLIISLFVFILLFTSLFIGINTVFADKNAIESISNPFIRACAEADIFLAPYRNAMYLYLRLAGVVWITVEWVAAILLWRGLRLLPMGEPT